MLLVAGRAGVRCPALEVMTALPTGSLALALEEVSGQLMSEMDDVAIDDALLDETWRQADTLHRGRLAHRALHPSNIVVHHREPVIIDFASAESSAPPRLLAIDRAELIASLAATVGPERAIGSAMRCSTRLSRVRDAVSAAARVVCVGAQGSLEVALATAA
jgi:tRNA A-37 threonylcarbamoyl transferase component Bud32